MLDTKNKVQNKDAEREHFKKELDAKIKLIQEQAKQLEIPRRTLLNLIESATKIVDKDKSGDDDEIEKDFDDVDVDDNYDDDDYEEEFGKKVDDVDIEDEVEDAEETIKEMVVTEEFKTFYNELKEALDITDEEIEEVLKESKAYTKKTKITIDPQSKFNRLVGGLTVKIARENNDVLYKKLIKFKKLWKAMKAKLRKKYQGKAISAAKLINKKET